MVTAAALALGGCAHRVTPAPSAAIADVRARIAERAEAPPDGCAAQPATIDVVVPFAYSEAALTDEGQAGLKTLTAWLACHPHATVAVAVAKEAHYRQPKVEQALREARLAAVMDWLHGAGVADSRLHLVSEREDPTTNPADAARLTLRGRGW